MSDKKSIVITITIVALLIVGGLLLFKKSGDSGSASDSNSSNTTSVSVSAPVTKINKNEQKIDWSKYSSGSEERKKFNSAINEVKKQMDVDEIRLSTDKDALVPKDSIVFTNKYGNNPKTGDEFLCINLDTPNIVKLIYISPSYQKDVNSNDITGPIKDVINALYLNPDKVYSQFVQLDDATDKSLITGQLNTEPTGDLSPGALVNYSYKTFLTKSFNGGATTPYKWIYISSESKY